jgi:DNA gyrase subunit B
MKFGLTADHVRMRPNMFLNGRDMSDGLFRLVETQIAFSVDEFQAGHASSVDIRIESDGSVSVADDGRGISVEPHPAVEMPLLEAVMTMPGANRGFDWRTYDGRTTGMLQSMYGVGSGMVTALSDWAVADVRWNGRQYRHRYERGVPVKAIESIGPANGSGLAMTFHPDPTIFENLSLNRTRLLRRCRELAFLNRRLRITLNDARGEESKSFRFENGIVDFVAHLNRSATSLHSPIHGKKEIGDVDVEFAIQYTKGDATILRCYCGDLCNIRGGTHRSGFVNGLCRALDKFGIDAGLLAGGAFPSVEECIRGMSAIVRVRCPEPQMESSRAVRLNNPEIERIVFQVVFETVDRYMRENPEAARRIVASRRIE